MTRRRRAQVERRQERKPVAWIKAGASSLVLRSPAGERVADPQDTIQLLERLIAHVQQHAPDLAAAWALDSDTALRIARPFKEASQEWVLYLVRWSEVGAREESVAVVPAPQPQPDVAWWELERNELFGPAEARRVELGWCSSSYIHVVKQRELACIRRSER